MGEQLPDGYCLTIVSVRTLRDEPTATGYLRFQPADGLVHVYNPWLPRSYSLSIRLCLQYSLVLSFLLSQTLSYRRKHREPGEAEYGPHVYPDLPQQLPLTFSPQLLYLVYLASHLQCTFHPLAASAVPDNRSRPGRTMAVRSLCNHSQVVSYRERPNTL